MGIRRRRLVRSISSLRRSRRLAAVRGRRASRRDRCDGGRCLQPRRPGWQLPEAVSEDYFTDRYTNEWGEALNFDGPGSGPLRELVCSNAAYWAREFHM